MSDLISRSKICKYIKELINPYGKPFEGTAYELGLKLMEHIKNMENAEPVEVVPVVHGEWIDEYINPYGHPCHCCSVCGFHASWQDKNFCPECGADMRKDE